MKLDGDLLNALERDIAGYGPIMIWCGPGTFEDARKGTRGLWFGTGRTLREALSVIPYHPAAASPTAAKRARAGRKSAAKKRTGAIPGQGLRASSAEGRRETRVPNQSKSVRKARGGAKSAPR